MNSVLVVLQNKHLWTAVTAMVIAQVIKVLIDYWRTNSWHTALFVSTGGMPSSHSALTVALMISVGFGEGFDTPLFAVSAVLAMVIMYDAAGVRRAAGKQAEAINFIISRLENQGIHLDEKLKELLGHRPVEVFAGATIGVITALAATLF